MENLQNLSANALMSQAEETAKSYMNTALISIDQRFGEGFAKNHPELVAAFMNTASCDFFTAVVVRELMNLRDQLASNACDATKAIENAVDTLVEGMTDLVSGLIAKDTD